MDRRALLAGVMIFAALAAARVLLRPERVAPVQPSAPGTLTVATLVDDLVDRGAAARLPDPPYTSASFTSTDRRSLRRGTEDWFANDDSGHYLRTEQHQGRTEHVLLDARGPGAVVRVWAANPHRAGTLRVYVDDRDDPVLAGPAAALLGGHGAVPEPLAQYRGRGHVLLLPIPYARSIRITVDQHRGRGLYYAITTRTWSPGTPVQSFSTGHLATLRRLAGRLAIPPVRPPTDASTRRLEPGQRVSLTLDGPGAIAQLSVAIPTAPASWTRDLWLVARFDGETTIEATVGGFFGTGLGANPHRELIREVRGDGTAVARWVMPFARDAEVSLENRGTGPAEVTLGLESVPWAWDARSMHLHAAHKVEAFDTYPHRDWDMVTVRGQGVYVGDTLEVFNPVEAWWGGGDEKIRVDGETFPSHFGTGTEDYYGYAYCSNELFAGLLHGQPRNDSAGHVDDACAHSGGHVTNTRVRGLDAIPFDRSLDFDLEVWHWEQTTVTYRATSVWYQRPRQPEATEP